ncbi:hypothetical protein CR513_40532, partial [Mucuna pruriens]
MSSFLELPSIPFFFTTFSLLPPFYFLLLVMTIGSPPVRGLASSPLPLSAWFLALPARKLLLVWQKIGAPLCVYDIVIVKEETVPKRGLMRRHTARHQHAIGWMKPSRPKGDDWHNPPCWSLVNKDIALSSKWACFVRGQIAKTNNLAISIKVERACLREWEERFITTLQGQSAFSYVELLKKGRLTPSQLKVLYCKKESTIATPTVAKTILPIFSEQALVVPSATSSNQTLVLPPTTSSE